MIEASIPSQEESRIVEGFVHGYKVGFSNGYGNGKDYGSSHPMPPGY